MLNVGRNEKMKRTNEFLKHSFDQMALNYKLRPRGLINPKWWLWQRGLHEWELRKRHMMSSTTDSWFDQVKKIMRDVDNDLGCFPYCRPKHLSSNCDHRIDIWGFKE